MLLLLLLFRHHRLHYLALGGGGVVTSHDDDDDDNRMKMRATGHAYLTTATVNKQHRQHQAQRRNNHILPPQTRGGREGEGETRPCIYIRTILMSDTVRWYHAD